MDNKCPVISSDASSLPEVYGEAALTFKSNSLSELLNCLNKITQDTSTREKLIINGMERIKQISWNGS